MPKVRVVLDTNVFISALINPRGAPAHTMEAWLKGEISVVVSLPILKELEQVLDASHIKTKYDISKEEVLRLIEAITTQANWVDVRGQFKLCRHPNDDLILETAILGKAKYLVSRDDDIKRDEALIAAMHSQGITIINVRSFLKKLKEGTL